MYLNQFQLLKDRRFLPIFIAQFCGCLNDSIIKSAVIILVTFKLSYVSEASSQNLVLLANALITLPFIIFASLAGQLADRFERSLLVKIIKLCEVIIIILAIYGFTSDGLLIPYICIGLLGIHSTFFGPIKYSVLPDHLEKHELLKANGLVEAGTFISILIGTMIGGFLNISNNYVINLALIISIIGACSSFYLKKSNNSNNSLKININIYRETLNMIKYSYSKKKIYLAILGISWFWFIGAAILAQIPSLARYTLGANENVANLFVAIFSIGVGIGSFTCNKILKDEISTKYLFISALGLSLFSFDLFIASNVSSINYEPEHLKNIITFLSKKNSWRILIDLFCFSAIGGIYVVPLYAMIQYFAGSAHRSRVVATNNLINSVFMVASTTILSILFYIGFSIPALILFISVSNILVAIYIYKLVPENRIMPVKFWMKLLKFIFDRLYRVQVKGFENFHKAGKRSVVIANHISYLDPALLAVYLPSNLIFAIDISVSKKSWVKPFLKLARALPVDSNNPMAIKTLIDIVRSDKKIAIFPEGRISVTGSLMKVYEGPGMIADKAQATILPIRIDGAQYTHFSKLKNKLKIKFFPKIVITILPPVHINPPEILSSQERRKHISAQLYNIMTEMIFESSDYKRPLFEALLQSSIIYKHSKRIIQDTQGHSLSNRKLLEYIFQYIQPISKDTKARQYVGIMLPNLVENIVVFYGVLASGRVAAMIDFCHNPKDIISNCQMTGIDIIYTSKAFIQENKLINTILTITDQGIIIRYLEDFNSEIDWWLKFKARIGSYFPDIYYRVKLIDSDPAVIQFNSDLNSNSKAIVLSHRNIQANRYQILSRFDFSTQDVAFNVLPLSTNLGLMGAIITSLGGIRSFYYPSPQHYRVIPEIIYYIGATILFGNDIILNNYARCAHPYDFYSLRYVFCDGLKLRDSTKQLWLNKYSIRIYENYGTNSVFSLIATNTRMYTEPTTLGKILPKIEYFIDSEKSNIENAGLLYLYGPNIIIGYIDKTLPKLLQDPYVKIAGRKFYPTQEIASVNSDGYLQIFESLKQNVVISGHKLSLQVIEDIAYEIDADNLHVAICLDHSTKSDKQIIVFTQGDIINQNSWYAAINAKALSDIYNQILIIRLPSINLLFSGEIDYAAMKAIGNKYLTSINDC